MTMTPGVRKLALTVHIMTSIGWFGAVAGFLALAVAGLTSQDAQVVRGAYLAMDLITWFVIVPFCLASLLTGIVQSLGTPWGLFRHYWVVAKLILIVLSGAHAADQLHGEHCRGDDAFQRRSARAEDPARGRRGCGPGGVARGHDPGGL